jgi:hypothetical protein
MNVSGNPIDKVNQLRTRTSFVLLAATGCEESVRHVQVKLFGENAGRSSD